MNPGPRGVLRRFAPAPQGAALLGVLLLRPVSGVSSALHPVSGVFRALHTVSGVLCSFVVLWYCLQCQTDNDIPGPV